MTPGKVFALECVAMLHTFQLCQTNRSKDTTSQLSGISPISVCHPAGFVFGAVGEEVIHQRRFAFAF